MALAARLALLALLALSMAQRAGAEGDNGDYETDAAIAQAGACRASGGTATTRILLEDDGGMSVSVTCTGGWAGGWKCENFDATTVCYALGMPLPVYEDGKPADGGAVRDDPAPPFPGQDAGGPTDGGAVRDDPLPAIAADRDCGDFKSRRQAQRFFKRNGGPQQDPHGLDADNDGKACETYNYR